MKTYTETHRLADIVFNNHLLLPVINRFGIKLGIRDKTIHEICIENNINPKFFLSIINTFSNEDYFPAEELLSFSPVLIVDYLQKTHQYYIEYYEPKMSALLSSMAHSCDADCQSLGVIKTFYIKYVKELFAHIQDEETKVFPYIKELYKSYVENIKIAEQYKDYHISKFEEEHTNVDEKLSDLKNLIIKYIEPTYDLNTCNEFLSALSNFERDIKDHTRIEDHILVPLVVDIENSLSHE